MLTADDFWVMLDARRHRTPRAKPAPPPPPSAERGDDESAYWLAQFADLDADPMVREALGPGPSMLTDDEVAEIEREIEAEGDLP